VGIGGLIYPRALGVGYDVIAQLLQGNATTKLILGVLLVKSLMWGISLGSGTSGGVLAPLLMMGGALGAMEALFLPHQGPGFWPLIAMGAILGGTMRSPLTGVIFSFELTGDYHSILPLLIACMTAHGFTVLTLKRSILTEKIARRGHHLSREYVVDPMEALAVEDVMRTDVIALPAEATIAELRNSLNGNEHGRGQRLYPVLRENKQLVGVMTRSDLHKLIASAEAPRSAGPTLADVVKGEPVVAGPHEPLRLVVNRMAASGLTRFPVVKSNSDRTLIGMIGLADLLKAREFTIDEEHKRERVLNLRLPPGLGRRREVGTLGDRRN
jgi:CIC family chloride channel protein